MSARRAATSPAVHDSATARRRPARAQHARARARRAAARPRRRSRRRAARAGRRRARRAPPRCSGSARTVTSTSSGGRRSSCACRRRRRRPPRRRARRPARRRRRRAGCGAGASPARARRAAMRLELERVAPDRRELARRARAARARGRRPARSSSPGAVPAGGITVAPRGTSACLRSPSRLSAGSVPRRRAYSAVMAGDRSRAAPRRARARRPATSATAATVRSSCVGPRPPEVMTRSWPASSRRPVGDLVVRRRRRCCTRCSSMPSASSSWARKRVLASATRPSSSSCPVTSSAAVGLPGVTAPRSPAGGPGSCPARRAGRSVSAVISHGPVAGEREGVAVDRQRDVARDGRLDREAVVDPAASPPPRCVAGRDVVLRRSPWPSRAAGS